MTRAAGRRRQVGSMSVKEFREEQAKAMLEKELLAAVMGCLREHGWHAYHTHTSIHSPRGFPDIFAVRGEVLLASELKRENGQPTDPQREWMAKLRAAGVRVYLWRPTDWLNGTIESLVR